MNDIRFAFRKLRQSPAFTSIAVITLALGIGLNTSIFSLINDLFLRGLPFKEPSRVVHLYGGDKSRELVDIGVSAPRYQHFRDGQTIFDGLAAENFFAFTLTGLGDPVQIFGGRLTSNYFDVLGVRPIRGRNFLPAEEEGADVALITEDFWQKRLGGDPNVIGRSITLDGTAHTIVGVLDNAQDVAARRDRKYSRRFHHAVRRGQLRSADRVQQRRQFVASPLQRTPPRDRIADGNRRFTDKHCPVVRF